MGRFYLAKRKWWFAPANHALFEFLDASSPGGPYVSYEAGLAFVNLAYRVSWTERALAKRAD